MHCKTRGNWPFSGSFFDFRVILASGGCLLKITLKDSQGRRFFEGSASEKGSQKIPCKGLKLSAGTEVLRRALRRGPDKRGVIEGPVA